MQKTFYHLLFIALLSVMPLDRSWSAELIMFEQPGCEWCERWDEEIGEIYNKTDEGRIAPLLRQDIDTPLTSEYDFIKRVIYTPTFVLVDNGKELGRIVGYPGEMHFWGLLGEMLPAPPSGVQASEAQAPESETDI